MKGVRTTWIDLWVIRVGWICRNPLGWVVLNDVNESRDECTEWSGDERGVSRIEFLRASVSEQWDVTGGYLLRRLRRYRPRLNRNENRYPAGPHSLRYWKRWNLFRVGVIWRYWIIGKFINLNDMNIKSHFTGIDFHRKKAQKWGSMGILP